MCLLRSTWLQEKCEEVRNGALAQQTPTRGRVFWAHCGGQHVHHRALLLLGQPGAPRPGEQAPRQRLRIPGLPGRVPALWD